MKLASLRLQNFRSCSDVTVAFDDYTCLVGQNGAGKSTILTALNILFRNADGASTSVTSLTEEDFCNRDTTAPIIITATFDDLSPAEAEDFRDYVRHEQLVVSAKATWNSERRSADVKQYGSRLVMRDFAGFFEALSDGAKASDLKAIYAGLRELYHELPAVSSKADMEQALRGYEESHREACELIESEDQFYGYTKGTNKLAKYLQWVYVPAVKDAASEQEEAKNTALGALLQRTLRPTLSFEEPLRTLQSEASQRYGEIIGEYQDALSTVSNSLEARLRDWAHPGARVQLLWNTDSDRAVSIQAPTARAKIGDDEFVGDVPRMGHGLQRAFIIALLQELAENGQADEGPRLLLGFEEPELYQHPPQARHLARVLEEMSGRDAQVIVTTHSPYFVSGRGFERVRMVRKEAADGRTTVRSMTHQQVAARIAAVRGDEPVSPTTLMGGIEQILQPSLNELFFCGVPILVEGGEDVAYLSTYLQLTKRWAAFRQSGCHFVIVGGKENMARPLAIAEGLGVPAFVVFDADGGSGQNQREQHRKTNLSLLRLAGEHDAEAFPQGLFIGNRTVVWAVTIGRAVEEDVGEDVWAAADQRVRATYDYHGLKGKNPLLITAILEDLWSRNVKVPVLDHACDAIVAHAMGQGHVSPPPEGAVVTTPAVP